LPEEVTLTKWLDAVFEYSAKQAGVSTEDYTVRVGSEGIAAGVEIPIDLFLSTLGAKIAKGLIGVGSLIYATFGKPPTRRLQSELLEVGSHWTFEILDPKPRDIMDLIKDYNTLIEGAKRKDWSTIFRALTRSPEEAKAALKALGIPVGSSNPTQTQTQQRPTVNINPQNLSQTKTPSIYEEGEEF